MATLHHGVIGSALACAWAALFGAQPALAQSAAPPVGQAVYQEHCAMCHEQLSDRISHREALQKLPAARILRALDAGAMLAIALSMHRDERIAVAAYLGTDAADSGPSPAAYCADRSVTLAAAPKAAWNGWSPTTANARHQSLAAAGLGAEQVPRLQLKWAFGFDGDVTAFAPPTVIDGQIFVGSAAGFVHAMRAESGCLQWVFQANGPVRSGIVATPLDGQHVLVFGDMTGWLTPCPCRNRRAPVEGARRDTRLDAAHGHVRGSRRRRVRPGVVVGETRSADPEYSCCTFRAAWLRCACAMACSCGSRT